jgi:Holliday junction resolvase
MTSGASSSWEDVARVRAEQILLLEAKLADYQKVVAERDALKKQLAEFNRRMFHVIQEMLK